MAERFLANEATANSCPPQARRKSQFSGNCLERLRALARCRSHASAPASHAIDYLVLSSDGRVVGWAQLA